MKIERINRIKRYRIFQDFTWPSDLSDFKEKNLIYGWNGTGKSTLSAIFRSIEKRQRTAEGDVEVTVSGKKIAGSDFAASQALPEVRVFNKDFVAENVFTTDGSVTPILFIGQDSIEKQKRVESLKAELESIKGAAAQKDAEKQRCEKAFDDFKRDKAKTIKDLLSSSGGNNAYNNYTARSLQLAYDQLSNLSESQIASKKLSVAERDSLRKQKEATSKEKISILSFVFPDLSGLRDQVKCLLEQTVVSSVIDALKNDQDLAAWTQTGLAKHREKSSSTCLFCEQPLPVGRLENLEAHFNEEYNRFLEKCGTLGSTIQSEKRRVSGFTIPDKANLYSHLAQSYQRKADDALKQVSIIVDCLTSQETALETKKGQPFQRMDLNVTLPLLDSSILSDINAIISQHNNETDDFLTTVAAARQRLEESILSDSYKDYLAKKSAISVAEAELSLLNQQKADLARQIGDIEKEIEEHHKPADELNADLRSYLGRDEITFRVLGNGYQIERNGSIAENLSEGEKTAIAFLYFLKSLNDKAFKMSDGIVVIDDPISSLDTNGLFHAFSFMKEQTKQAKQLFILTHSHSFFRQVKNWFNHLPGQKKSNPDQRPACFYMLSCSFDNGCRVSSLTKLDSLLHEYESEYHYLFGQVYHASNATIDSLEECYHLPNVARRLLETFLAFRQPKETGHVEQQLGLIDFDKAKKTRILRFLHTYSHSETFDGTGEDQSILTETKLVLSDLLDLIKSEDDRHFSQMKELVDPVVQNN